MLHRRLLHERHRNLLFELVYHILRDDDTFLGEYDADDDDDDDVPLLLPLHVVVMEID